MSSVAAASFISSILYVYYYAPGATFGTVFSISLNATSTSYLIQSQTVAGQGVSSVIKPTGAWMFPNLNNELTLMVQQSPPLIVTLTPQGKLTAPVSPIPYTTPNVNNFTWTFADRSSVPNVIPPGSKQPWISSGSSDGSAMYEVFVTNVQVGTGSPVATTYVGKVDLTSFATGTASMPLSQSAAKIDPTVAAKIVRLPAVVSSSINAAAVGRCLSSPTLTCTTFFIEANGGSTLVSAESSQQWDPTSCLIATNNLIIMITKSGMSTFNYAVSVGELLTGTWTTPTKSPLPNAVLSCAINGTQLIAVLQDATSGTLPAVYTASVSGSWALLTLNTPVLQPTPPPPPTGSTGDSGGTPGSGGVGGNNSNNGTNSNSGSNGSLTGGSTTGLGKPVIIGIAVAAAVLLILIPALLILWCRRKRQNGKEREQKTEELKKSIVLEHGGGKRMGMSMPLPRVIPPVPPRHSPLTFLLETPGTTPALGGMAAVGGNDRDSHTGSSSVPGSSHFSYDEKFSNHQSQQPFMQSLPHPYHQPSRTWSQDGGNGGNGSSPSPRTLNQHHQHSFSDNDSTAGPGSVDGYQTDSRMAGSRGGIFDDKHEIMDDQDDRDLFAHHERSTTSMSYLKSPALTDLEPPMPLMSPMYSPPGVHYQTPSSESVVTANSTPMIKNATKPKRIRIEDMVSPGLINAQLILQQSQKPQKPSNLR